MCYTDCEKITQTGLEAGFFCCQAHSYMRSIYRFYLCGWSISTRVLDQQQLGSVTVLILGLAGVQTKVNNWTWCKFECLNIDIPVWRSLTHTIHQQLFSDVQKIFATALCDIQNNIHGHSKTVIFFIICSHFHPERPQQGESFTSVTSLKAAAQRMMSSTWGYHLAKSPITSSCALLIRYNNIIIYKLFIIHVY